MKLVIDEGVPKQLASALLAAGLDAHKFNKEWRGLKNGALIAMVERSGHAVLLTNDKNLLHQQNLLRRSVAIVSLPLNKRSALMKRVDDFVDTIRRAKPGQHISIGLDGTRTAVMAAHSGTMVEALPPVAPFAT